jgi:hypothetical protein
MASVTITVIPVNDPPTAADDSLATDEDTSLSISAAQLLANDADVDGDPLGLAVVAAPSHGALAQNPDGSLSYAPDSNYHGVDSFTYKLNDGAADSNVATVVITINSVNDAPLAVDDQYTLDQGGSLIVDAASGVLANDSDIDGDALSATLVAAPAHGALSLDASGALTYTPAAGFSGVDSFTYTAGDGALESAAATITLVVQPVAGIPKFLVVDASARDTFRYDAYGTFVDRHDLHREDQKPRGVATNGDGSLVWVVDAKGVVFVYNAEGRRIGAWEAKGIDKPEGIATDGQHLWIVDRETDRVFFFADGAHNRWLDRRPTASLKLDFANRNPMDVATDGKHLWVVEDGRRTDSVFRYNVAGTLEGSWQIDAANAMPTGLTIDPNDVQHVWIVDARTDRVYQYHDAASRTSGQQAADAVFALDAANHNPQGIADPRSLGSAAEEESGADAELDAALVELASRSHRREVHAEGHDESPISAHKDRPLAATPTGVRTEMEIEDHRDRHDEAIREVVGELEFEAVSLSLTGSVRRHVE